MAHATLNSPDAPMAEMLSEITRLTRRFVWGIAIGTVGSLLGGALINYQIVNSAITGLVSADTEIGNRISDLNAHVLQMKADLIREMSVQATNIELRIKLDGESTRDVVQQAGWIPDQRLITVATVVVPAGGKFKIPVNETEPSLSALIKSDPELSDWWRIYQDHFSRLSEGVPIIAAPMSNDRLREHRVAGRDFLFSASGIWNPMERAISQAELSALSASCPGIEVVLTSAATEIRAVGSEAVVGNNGISCVQK